jgi:hypothetical protein
MTSCAALPTASMAHEVKTNTHAEPSSPPMKTSGTVMSTPYSCTEETKLTSSMKALKSKKHARLALPTL